MASAATTAVSQCVRHALVRPRRPHPPRRPCRYHRRILSGKRSISTFPSSHKFSKAKERVVLPLKWSIPAALCGWAWLHRDTGLDSKREKEQIVTEEVNADVIARPAHAPRSPVKGRVEWSGGDVFVLATSSSVPEREETAIVTPEKPKESQSENSGDDDYSDLPEEDEDTHCVICLINRQGPCQNPWRRFEKCMKDNSEGDDDEENTSNMVEKCGDISMHWIGCIENYRQTYARITNEFYQPEIEDMERGLNVKDGPEPFPDRFLPSLDLGNWYAYLEEDSKCSLKDNDEISRDVGNESNAPTTPSQQQTTLPEIFLSGYAKFRLKDDSEGEDNSVLDVAYVRDQNGRLLGFDYFTREKRETKEEAELVFNLTPDVTSVKMFAVYKTTKAVTVTGETETDEARLKGTALVKLYMCEASVLLKETNADEE